MENNNSDASPINAFIEQNRNYHSPTSPIFNPYAYSESTSSENSDSAFFRYLRSSSSSGRDTQKRHSMIGNQFRGSITSSSGSLGSRGSSSARSPFSAIENIETPPSRSRPVFTAPVNVEEDVIVMDGVLVESVDGARRRCFSSPDSGSSSSSGSKNSCKKEICRLREDSGSCRNGTKCQFTHGKENQRLNRLPHKSKSEGQLCKTYTGAQSLSDKFPFFHHESCTTFPAAATLTTPHIILPVKVEYPRRGRMITSNTDRPPRVIITAPSSPVNLTTASTTSAIRLRHPIPSTMITHNTDYSPLDDGIEFTIPHSASAATAPSREEVDATIQSLLYAPSGRRRLPVFIDICPD